jgi:hypothetical protein
MESIKRFWLDESATAEASSTVIMIAFVGILLLGALGVYYTSMENFFGRISGYINDLDWLPFGGE